jgi:hypothetical protein
MSIEVSNLRVTKLRAYLMNIITELIGQYGEMNINFLSNEPNNYSLDKIPINPTTEEWIIGSYLERDVYSFRSRMNYSADTITNIENIGFYETFERIIKQKNDSNDLPEIDGIQSISCLNCGTMNNANTNTAEFDIQIQIEYREV